MLTKRPDEAGAEHVRALRDAGAGPEAIETVVHVCAAFNMIDRIADSLEFHVPSEADFARSAGILLRMGYK